MRVTDYPKPVLCPSDHRRQVMESVESVNRCGAGIDVHKKMLAVVVRRPTGETVEYIKRKFGTMKREIDDHLVAWLREHRVSEVVIAYASHCTSVAR